MIKPPDLRQSDTTLLVWPSVNQVKWIDADLCKIATCGAAKAFNTRNYIKWRKTLSLSIITVFMSPFYTSLNERTGNAPPPIKEDSLGTSHDGALFAVGWWWPKISDAQNGPRCERDDRIRVEFGGYWKHSMLAIKDQLPPHASSLAIVDHLGPQFQEIQY